MTAVRPVVSTVQVCDAGESSTSEPSTARTRKVCSTSERLVKLTPLVQAAKPAPSRLHSKVAPACEAVKAKVALVLVVVTGGAEVMVVSSSAGTTMVKTRIAGVLVLPAA